MKAEIKRADGTLITIDGDAVDVARVVRDALGVAPVAPHVVPAVVPWAPPMQPVPPIPPPTIWWGTSHPVTGEPNGPTFTTTHATARDWDIDPIFAPSFSCTVMS